MGHLLEKEQEWSFFRKDKCSAGKRKKLASLLAEIHKPY
jgi:hypothetical protein